MLFSGIQIKHAVISKNNRMTDRSDSTFSFVTISPYLLFIPLYIFFSSAVGLSPIL